ncbi:MAG TPA: CPBP family glutamic-type intramembrane protease [Chthonomonadaceae bacterium]|nr:CPBP family glutamic-type intramembrane protease [Chthonomonadaceae bacterium]
MDNLDTNTAVGLFLVLLGVGLILLLADAVIFILWIKYRIELANTPLPYPAPPLVEGATEGPPPEPEPYPLGSYVRPPFARTWSVVDPFLSFQAIFLTVQVLAGILLLPVIMQGMFSSSPAGTPSHVSAAPTQRAHPTPTKPTSAEPAPAKPTSTQLSPEKGATQKAASERPSQVKPSPEKPSPSRPSTPQSKEPQRTAARSASPAAKPQSAGAIDTSGLLSPYGLAVQIGALVLQNVLFVGIVALYLRRYGTSLSEIGLRKPTPNELLLGLGLGIVLFLLATGCDLGVGVALKHISPQLAERLTKLTEDITAGGFFDKIASNGWKLAFVLTGAVAAPIGEEVFFRGFLYNALKRRWGVPVGIIVSGLTFALIHFGPLAIIVIFPMGILLAYVYERTNSLWVTILMHMLNNGAAFMLAWFWPQLGK